MFMMVLEYEITDYKLNSAHLQTRKLNKCLRNITAISKEVQSAMN